MLDNAIYNPLTHIKQRIQHHA